MDRHCSQSNPGLRETPELQLDVTVVRIDRTFEAEHPRAVPRWRNLPSLQGAGTESLLARDTNTVNPVCCNAAWTGKAAHESLGCVRCSAVATPRAC